MGCYRIYSTMIDDGDHQPDSKTTIVIHAKLTDEGKLDSQMEAFGYSNAWDEEVGYQKYPFMLKHQGNRKQTGKFDFAGWDSETDHRTNLFEKTIRKGETFTYFEVSSGGAETVYRIESVLEI
jgi:hypothetical protein